MSFWCQWRHLFFFLEAQFFLYCEKQPSAPSNLFHGSSIFSTVCCSFFFAFLSLTICLDPGANSQLLVPFRVGADVLSIELSWCWHKHKLKRGTLICNLGCRMWHQNNWQNDIKFLHGQKVTYFLQSWIPFTDH